MSFGCHLIFCSLIFQRVCDDEQGKEDRDANLSPGNVRKTYCGCRLSLGLADSSRASKVIVFHNSFEDLYYSS